MATGREGDVLVELQQTVRVISQKETGEPSAAGRRPVAITAAGQDGDSLPFINTGSGANPVDAQSGGGVGGWLVAFTDESNERLRCIQERKKPKIQRVPSLLRDVETNKPFFEPEVVSLGPYHHGRQKFAAMEENKGAAAKRFAGGQAVPMCVFYDKVKSVASAAREWYADKFEDINDEDFAIMMFIDGCFILHFIDCCMKVEKSLHTTKAHLHGVITRDMFLLENQVPFVVLNALMSLRPVKYEEFVRKITGDTNTTGSGKKKKRYWWSPKAPTLEPGAEEGPAHLLDLLRTKLLGRELPKNQRTREANWPSFRSVMELREAGITFSKSRSCCLRDVEFSVGLVYGQLQLPPIVVDDMVRPKFLNLIAMEMCPDSSSDYGVTSYICLLDSLIDHADDVKELRRKRILLNGLGSDQQVADLFNELTTGLSPENFPYAEAVCNIDKHYNSKKKVSFARMLHTHFSSPWTAISFFAALLLILLTTTQTYYTIFPKSDKY